MMSDYSEFWDSEAKDAIERVKRIEALKARVKALEQSLSDDLNEILTTDPKVAHYWHEFRSPNRELEVDTISFAAFLGYLIEEIERTVELERVLGMVEWILGYCPLCFKFEDVGHSSTCELWIALGKQQPSEGEGEEE